jgi:hypothetical protein
MTETGADPVRRSGLLLVVTLITAVVLPPLGLALGLWAGFRSRREGQQGTAVACFALAALAVAVMVFAGVFGLLIHTTSTSGISHVGTTTG